METKKEHTIEDSIGEVRRVGEAQNKIEEQALLKEFVVRVILKADNEKDAIIKVESKGLNLFDVIEVAEVKENNRAGLFLGGIFTYSEVMER